MSARYRRLIMEMVTPALDVFLKSFTNKPRDLLYYLANKSKIEQTDVEGRTKDDNRQNWRDSVRLAITKNCFVVRTIVDRFNSAEGNDKAAHNTRIMALSELVVGFSYETVVCVCHLCLFVCHTFLFRVCDTHIHPPTRRNRYHSVY